MPRITVRLSKQLYEKFMEAIKKSEYETVSEFLRECIRDFVKKYEEVK